GTDDLAVARRAACRPAGDRTVRGEPQVRRVLAELRTTRQPLDHAREVVAEKADHAHVGRAVAPRAQLAAVLGEELLGRLERIAGEPACRTAALVEAHERVAAREQGRGRLGGAHGPAAEAVVVAA